MDGELSPSSGEAVKLTRLQTILKYHERGDVYTVKLINIPQAAIGLHASSVLLISRHALGLLKGTELRALVAHEVGHEYFWEEYEKASEREDRDTLQALELKCDGLATLTLISLGDDPLSLVRGARKLIRFNEARGATANSSSFPPLIERERFIRALWARHRESRMQ